jgi:hypothetical protein
MTDTNETPMGFDFSAARCMFCEEVVSILDGNPYTPADAVVVMIPPAPYSGIYNVRTGLDTLHGYLCDKCLLRSAKSELLQVERVEPRPAKTSFRRFRRTG